eukprot:snap_masked-scaffold_13-processed-gene-6.39-mRNA-1 protein AED:0.02 eAED:0.02 QI:0/-1/0/1/-1/1/1/0/128
MKKVENMLCIKVIIYDSEFFGIYCEIFQRYKVTVRKTMVRVIRILQKLVVAEGVGQALVPYYRQLLPIFNLFKNNNLNLGDGIDYSQQKNDNLGDLINETLALFELHGGDDAFINIKYLIPTYQSVKA